MNALQRATIWMVGCLVLVFGLSIALSWWSYGYVDGPTVWAMAGMLLPVLGAAAAVVLWSGRRSEARGTEPRDAGGLAEAGADLRERRRA